MLTFLLLAALTQITPDQPLPKGTGLPPVAVEAVGDAPAVLATVNRLLDALGAGDGAAILAITRAEGGATAALERPDGGGTLRHRSWADLAAATRVEGYREAITDPAVEVDGDIAMVWAPYTVTKNGSVDHCGFDHFDLVREGGGWRVLNVTWTQRSTGCTVP